MNSGDSDQGENCSSRREILSRVASLSLIGIVAQIDPANAAAPITVAETGNVGALAQRAFRNKPPKVLRNTVRYLLASYTLYSFRLLMCSMMILTNGTLPLSPQLNIDFAVLLMRSSYNALDQLNCVAMDQFQRDFFILVSGHVVLEGFGIQNELVSLTYCMLASLSRYISLEAIRV
jgi:hypothetical protein